MPNDVGARPPSTTVGSLDSGSLEIAEQPLAEILSLDQLVAKVVILRAGDLSSEIGEVVVKEHAQRVRFVLGELDSHHVAS